MNTAEITGKTRLCGIIGNPVEHTVSPAMHNSAFKSLGLDYFYVAFRVTEEGLADAVKGMRALNIKGLNVTIPHKTAVISLLDELDNQAQKIGAVNTIVNENGKLKGYNTDAEGFLQALLEKGVDPQGKKIAVLGAGGASRAICFALAGKNASLTILNRTATRAADLAYDISRVCGDKVRALQLNHRNLEDALGNADLLVNTTSVGMSPDSSGTPVPAGLLNPRLTVIDIVYNPGRTRLLADAEKAGAGTIGGIDMLVWQGALSFEKWTGLKPPLKLMRSAAARALQENEK